MCQEVFNLVLCMDKKAVETQLALQCAPLITGIKISNLLIVPSENEKTLRTIMHQSGLSFYRLIQTDEKMTFLLFHRADLQTYLQKKETQQFLKEEGYENLEFGNILRRFQERYQQFMQGNSSFPHEMGLLLGYPIEDVQGFVEHDGENYLYSGYWKVYADVEKKIELFQEYENAKEYVIQKLAEGVEMKKFITWNQRKRAINIAG